MTDRHGDQEVQWPIGKMANMHIITGVYILSQNFIIAPKRNKCVMKIFIIAPNLHVVRNGIS